MSYHSVHMNHPIKGGYRISQLERCTVAMLSRKTWRELRTPDTYLNGNTKWQEMPIVAFYFKNGFLNSPAARDIGYQGSIDYRGSKGRSIIGRGLTFRLDRVNPQELLSFGLKLMMSGLLKKNWAWILDPTRGSGKTFTRHSKQRITFSKAIVNQALAKYGLVSVSWKLRVDMKVITFWRDYEI